MVYTHFGFLLWLAVAVTVLCYVLARRSARVKALQEMRRQLVSEAMQSDERHNREVAEHLHAHPGSGGASLWWMIGLLAAAGVLGLMVVLPIGGADMPVVISLLNAMTGLSAAAAGLALNNTAMIVAGMCATSSIAASPAASFTTATRTSSHWATSG